MKTSLIVLALIVGFFKMACKIAERCFDDEDPDMFWDDNYAAPSKGYYGYDTPVVKKCDHKTKTDVVVWASTVCEEIHTICDDCSTVLNRRVDC